ncbi:hypothetical protein C8R45DRAFT_933533 [Mycena sanguinolenta]|nr:hypothetical protein C8R45DRAFT_933533 [Mycena sanguinolenta]
MEETRNLRPNALHTLTFQTHYPAQSRCTRRTRGRRSATKRITTPPLTCGSACFPTGGREGEEKRDSKEGKEGRTRNKREYSTALVGIRAAMRAGALASPQRYTLLRTTSTPTRLEEVHACWCSSSQQAGGSVERRYKSEDEDELEYEQSMPSLPPPCSCPGARGTYEERTTAPSRTYVTQIHTDEKTRNEACHLGSLPNEASSDEERARSHGSKAMREPLANAEPASSGKTSFGNLPPIRGNFLPTWQNGAIGGYSGQYSPNCYGWQSYLAWGACR